MSYFAGASDLIMPFFIPFLIVGTIALFITISSRWKDATPQGVRLAVFIWLALLLGGVVTLYIEVIVGLFVSALASLITTAIGGRNFEIVSVLVQYPVLALV